MTVGMGIRMGGQMVVFLVVARVLGVESYGAYVAVLALASAFGGLAGFGANALLVRDVARGRLSFPDALGRTLAGIWVSVPPLLLTYLLIAWLMLRGVVSWIPIVAIGFAEVVLAPLLFTAVSAYQAHERMDRAAWMVIIPIIPRGIGALAMVALVQVIPPAWYLPLWSLLYAIAALLAVSYAFVWVRAELGRAADMPWSLVLKLWREGYPFSIGGMALKIYSEIDKTMLVRLSSLETAGIYSAGYRVVDMANVPLRALLSSAMPRFFRAGADSHCHALGYALRMAPLPMAYAAAIGMAMYLLADILPWILGDEYGQSATAVRYLAFLPLVAAPRMLLQSALGGSGRQGIAVSILVAGAVVNILLNLWLIPLWGWRGALAATYSVELIMMVAMAAGMWIGEEARKRNV